MPGNGVSTHAPRLSVAPMMGWTDQHYRALARLLTADTKLYTEMISAEEIVSGSDAERARLLKTCRDESPVAIQLGGSKPETLKEAICILKAAKTSEWVEINLNCGCPSPRVSHQSDSCFGARMMHQPERVRACAEALAKASGSVPVTVKCRLGTDELNGYDRLSNFINIVQAGGVRHFAVHARECVLEGLNPAQNRTIPPLKPRWVHSLQRDFPELSFAVNGGIKTIAMAQRHLEHENQEYGSYATAGLDESQQSGGVEHWSELPAVREVAETRVRTQVRNASDVLRCPQAMIGREAFNNPWMLRHADPVLHGRLAPASAESRQHVVEAYLDTVDRRGDTAEYLAMQPLLTLFAGERGGKAWRRHLQEGWKAAKGHGDVRRVVEAALESLPLAVRDSR